MVLPPLCKKFSERFLQIGAFSSSLRRDRSFGESGRMQENGIFLHMDFKDYATARTRVGLHDFPPSQCPDLNIGTRLL